MSYGSNKQLSSLKAEVCDYHQNLQELDDVVKKQQAEIEKLRNEFENTKDDLPLLNNISNYFESFSGEIWP